MSEIVLREIARSDLETINAWRADKNLVDLLGSPFRYVGIEVDHRWFDAYLNARAHNVRLAICRKDSGQIIGVVYLLQIDWVNRSAEFSIQLGAHTELGMGFGEQATRMAIRHAFSDLNLRRVHLTVLSTNERAIALYKKVGFETEGCFRQALFKNGSYVDVISMAILSSDILDK